MLHITKYFNNIVNKTGFKRSKPTLVYHYKVLCKHFLHFNRDLKSFFFFGIKTCVFDKSTLKILL